MGRNVYNYIVLVNISMYFPFNGGTINLIFVAWNTPFLLLKINRAANIEKTMKSFLFIMVSLCSAALTHAGNWDVSVARYRGDKTCAVSYTFDDGLAEHYTLVAPQLESRGWRGTFWINGSKINQDPVHLADTTRMTWAQLWEMSNQGHEISNHGWQHKNFARFPIEEIREDILKNDSAIFANTGVMPRTFCYPNNNKKAEGRRIAEQNRVGTRLEQWSVGSKRSKQDLNNWVDALMANRGWGVGMTHGLTYGYDAFRNPQRLWEHFDYVKGKEDRIWVGTFREVVSYVKERDAVQLEVKQKKKRLYVTPLLSLDKELFLEPLTLVIKGAQMKKVSAKQDKKNLPVTVYADKAVLDFNPFGGTVEIHIR